MSIFSKLFGGWPSFRDMVLKDIEEEVVRLEPAGRQALVSAAQAGAKAFLAAEGTNGDKGVAARNAAVSSLEVSGKTISLAVLNDAISGELANPTPTPMSEPAPTEAPAS